MYFQAKVLIKQILSLKFSIEYLQTKHSLALIGQARGRVSTTIIAYLTGLRGSFSSIIAV